MKSGQYQGASVPDEYVDISSGRAVFQPEISHGGKYGRKKSNKGKIAVIISVAVVVAAALGITGFCLMNNVNKEPEKKVPVEFKFPGTKVSGIDITGKNFKDAKKLLEANKKKFIKPVKIDITANGEPTQLTQEDFSYTYDIDKVLETAKREAESGGESETAATTDTEGKKEYKVTATVTTDSISNNVTNFCENNDKEAVNAWVSKFHPYSDNRFEYEDAIEGYKVNSNDLKNKLVEFFASGNNYAEIQAEGETLKAEVSKDFLKKNIVKLATYKTISYNSMDGTTNMKVALEACNGSIIDPNKIWSFNECTGDSNQTENGYKPAGVISEGQFTTGVGGGICQASSTIYNAAIRANMTIEDRYCHQFSSAYVPTGLDATIDYPRLDLKLENTSGYQMFLECKVDGTTLYATFWGYHSPDYDVIKTRNKLESQGDKTYKVRAWRVYYKDGKKVDEEELFVSEYDYGGSGFIDAEGDTGAEDIEYTAPSDTSSESSTAESSSASTNDSEQSNSDQSYNQDTGQSDTPVSTYSEQSSNTDESSAQQSQPSETPELTPTQ